MTCSASNSFAADGEVRFSWTTASRRTFDSPACVSRPGDASRSDADSGLSECPEECWLRTECGENRLTLFPGARMQIGPRSLINGAMLSAKSELSIGSEALIGFGVRVLDSDQHDLDRDHPERTEPVRIGNRVWIGADSMVLRGSTIGDDVVIGARSLVTGDIPSGVLALGVPAKPIREIGSRAGCN